MVVRLQYKLVNTIYEDERTLIQRVRNEQDGKVVILKTLPSVCPTL
jgi:hypothetical protein